MTAISKCMARPNHGEAIKWASIALIVLNLLIWQGASAEAAHLQRSPLPPRPFPFLFNHAWARHGRSSLQNTGMNSYQRCRLSAIYLRRRDDDDPRAPPPAAEVDYAALSFAACPPQLHRTVKVRSRLRLQYCFLKTETHSLMRSHSFQSSLRGSCPVSRPRYQNTSSVVQMLQ